MFAHTPNPPYYAVIFTSILSDDNQGYAETADLMVKLARQQPGFLGMESAREEVGITVSYWRTLDAIKAWKQQSDHAIAQQKGRESWYQDFSVRISKVEHEYRLNK